MNKNWIFAFLALVLILFFYWRNRHPPLVPSPAAKVDEQVEETGAEKIIAVSAESGTNLRQLQESQRQEYSHKVLMGISSTHLPVVGGQAAMTIVLKPQPLWCRGGETDAMKRFVTSPDAPELLLTVEVIGKEKKALFSKNYSVTQLESGDKVSFTLPAPSSRNELYGVYLCRDRDKQGSCQRKKLVDYVSMAKMGGNTLKRSNNIFLFHKVLLKPDGGLDLFSASGDKAQTKSIENYLATEQGVAQKSLQFTGNIERSLHSTPLRVKDATIELPITVGDRTCLQGLGTIPTGENNAEGAK